MLEYIRKLWKIEDLRKKILYTFGMLILFRLVGCIPAPGIDTAAVGLGGNNLPLLDVMNMMTGGSFRGMVHPEDYVSVSNSINKQIERSEDNMDFVKYRIITKKGVVKQVRDYGHLVHDAGDTDLYYVFLVEDF